MKAFLGANRNILGRNKASRDGFAAYCKPCRSVKNRAHYFKRSWGLSTGAVREILENQEWQCLICHIELTEKTAHVDHDHSTREVRGILCFNCNSGLGKFGDDPVRLRNAAFYVEGDPWGWILDEPLV